MRQFNCEKLTDGDLCGSFTGNGLFWHHSGGSGQARHQVVFLIDNVSKCWQGLLAVFNLVRGALEKSIDPDGASDALSTDLTSLTHNLAALKLLLQAQLDQILEFPLWSILEVLTHLDFLDCGCLQMCLSECGLVSHQVLAEAELGNFESIVNHLIWSASKIIIILTPVKFQI